MASPDAPDDPVAVQGDDGLPGVRREPEPDWVEGIRRGREERARRLRTLLGPPEHPAELEAPPAKGPPPAEEDPATEHPAAEHPDPPS